MNWTTAMVGAGFGGDSNDLRVLVALAGRPQARGDELRKKSLTKLARSGILLWKHNVTND
jgi:hypothetical protein